MTLSSILLLFAYPLAIFLLPQPNIFRWIREHGKNPLPQAELAAAEQNRTWYFLQILIVVCALFLWARYNPSLFGELPFSTKNPVRHLAEGIAAGSILLLGRFAYVTHPGHRISRLRDHPFARGAVGMWFLIFVAVGAVEEIWRACCILSLQANDFASITAIAATSIAFVFAHMSGIPGRIVGIREEVFWELLFGLALGFLFVEFGTIITPYIAALQFNIGNLYVVRGKTGTDWMSSAS